MSRKSKGINAERELIHAFWSAGLPSIRVAGSGAIKYPSPDIIVGNDSLKVAIECKVCKDTIQYFSKEEISDLLFFASKFGARAFVAVKFNRRGWCFVEPHQLTSTARSYLFRADQASDTFSLSRFFEQFKKG